jgi:hypothetical protein
MFVCLLCQSTVLNWRRGEGVPLAQIVLEAISLKFARRALSRTTPGKRAEYLPSGLYLSSLRDCLDATDKRFS